MSSKTMRRSAAGAVATGFGMLAIGFGGTSTALGADCGDVNPLATDVKAKNVTCKKAKKVVQAWAFGVDLGGYSCEGTSRVTCRKGNAVVKFNPA
jgi:hypothetical protein